MSAAKTPRARAALFAPLLAFVLAACAGPSTREPVPVEGAGGLVATRHRSAPGALGPYSGSVQAGELLFLSGKIGERGGSFEREARTAVAAVVDELARAGAAPADLLSVTVYLTDMARYAEFNAVYAELLPAPHPARACVAVAALPADARVEIQAVARAPRAARGGPSP